MTLSLGWVGPGTQLAKPTADFVADATATTPTAAWVANVLANPSAKASSLFD